jgi:hypothetical protein
VAGLATDNIAALADFDVTAADVTALTTARTAFADMKDSPRQVAVGRKTQTFLNPATNRERAEHLPQRDRQNGDEEKENESRLVRGLFRRAYHREPRGDPRRAKTSAASNAPEALKSRWVCPSSTLGRFAFAPGSAFGNFGSRDA